ncbi:SAM-dependent methyltransferase [Desulfosporosinus sp. OT]|uniref:SAM-dependent methyltransferase n=1 Tax=Desulfosporosinus sp. OT TaxID=913865 RepID=UPI000223A161|nr:SAM-dependent methyltransferase [Desulfosporosinus sp. OT]EGW39309.1 methyltransferase, TIGR00027 family protein [Desulfosporosinus sp. OT]
MFQSVKTVTYQVSDIEKAKDWYCKILNKEPAFNSPFAVIFVIDDSVLMLAPTSNPLSGSDERIVAYWGVENIDVVYQKLLELGATPHTEINTVADTKSAKVVDPFGNILGITSKVLAAKDRSVENQPSETANGVTFCRALAARDEREEFRGPDYLAEIFLTEDGKRPLKDRASREWVINNLITPERYGYLIARTAYIDDIFKQSLRENIPQIVFLGAGYDTRSYRLKELIKETRIFELDIQTTQQRKKEKLNQSNISIPEQLTFVSINFKSDVLEKVLFKAGFDKNKKALFIWEGVMYYLPAEAVNNTLKFVKLNSPVGSTICFDYLTAERQSVNAGEPFLFWIEEERIESFLSERGYKIMERLTSKDMESKYLSVRNGSVVGKVIPHFSFVHASVLE